jgi:hypothetical protein
MSQNGRDGVNFIRRGRGEGVRGVLGDGVGRVMSEGVRDRGVVVVSELIKMCISMGSRISTG